MKSFSFLSVLVFCSAFLFLLLLSGCVSESTAISPMFTLGQLLRYFDDVNGNVVTTAKFYAGDYNHTVPMIDGNRFALLDLNRDGNFVLNQFVTNNNIYSGSGIDTNWETSWVTFDANMKATYPVFSDVFSWIDGNKGAGGIDTNVWTAGLINDQNYVMDNIQGVSIKPNNRQLIASDGNTILTWNNISQVGLFNSGSDGIKQLVFNGLTNVGNFSFDTLLGFFHFDFPIADASDKKSLDPNVRSLYDSGENLSIDWENRDLNGTWTLNGTTLTTESGSGTPDGNIYSIGIMNPDYNNMNIDLNMGLKNIIDTNNIYTTTIISDNNTSYGIIYCTDGNIIVGYVEGYSC